MEQEKWQASIAEYFSSLESDAQLLLHAVCTHWGIENQVHWVLEIAFREDDCRIRKGNGAENSAVLRHIALNLLRREKTSTGSLKDGSSGRGEVIVIKRIQSQSHQAKNIT